MIPDEDFSRPVHINFAPMVDFLFLVLAIFAIALAMKTSLFDSDISLVKTKTKFEYSSDDKSVINVSISPAGQYRWLTDYNQYPLESAESLTQEIQKQQIAGILPQEQKQIAVLVHIDKDAPWEPIAKLLIEMKKEGYPTHPVYEAETP